MDDQQRTRVSTTSDELAALLDDRAHVESAAVHEEDKIVIVTIRLPNLPEAERLRLEEWVHTQLELAQGGLGHGYMLVPRYV